MEGLAHLVAESLVRHGVETPLDHRRLQWSNWFRCVDSLSALLAPFKPGMLAVAEEVIAPDEAGASAATVDPVENDGIGGKRMLALLQVAQADDLGMALGGLFLSDNPLRERLLRGRCFARFVVIEDPVQRRDAHTALRRWMASET